MVVLDRKRESVSGVCGFGGVWVWGREKIEERKKNLYALFFIDQILFYFFAAIFTEQIISIFMY